MTFPQTLHLLLTSGNHEQNQRTCYKVSSIVYTCVVFLWRNNICKEQLRLCLERVLNSYKLYSISKVRHKGFECWIWWNVTQASVLSVWEWGNSIAEPLGPNIGLSVSKSRMAGRFMSSGYAQRLFWAWQDCPGEESLPLWVGSSHISSC